MTGTQHPDLDRLAERSVVAVIRVAELSNPLALVDALAAGGITGIEFTFTSSNAPQAVELTRRSRPDVVVGAGTIRTREQLEVAVAAGAQFGVSPHLDPGLVTAAQQHDLPYIPGVLTPSEVASALQLGSEMIKLYPARAVGTKHLGDLLSVFPEARLMVTGGIGLDQVSSYLEAGAAVVGLGGALTAGADGSGDLSPLTERALRVTGTRRLADGTPRR